MKNQIALFLAVLLSVSLLVSGCEDDPVDAFSPMNAPVEDDYSSSENYSEYIQEIEDINTRLEALESRVEELESRIRYGDNFTISEITPVESEPPPTEPSGNVTEVPLSYEVIDAYLSKADNGINAFVTVKNTDNVTGTFCVVFDFMVDGEVVFPDSRFYALIFPGKSERFERGLAYGYAGYDENDNWSLEYEVIAPTKTVTS